MKRSKEVFEDMREQEVFSVEQFNLYDSLNTKKVLVKRGADYASELLDSGVISTPELVANLARLKVFVEAMDKVVREGLVDAKFEHLGVKVSTRNGGSSLNYEEDEDYRLLKEMLKKREELLTFAAKTKDVFYDSDGCEVTKVSSTPRKDSVTISF